MDSPKRKITLPIRWGRLIITSVVFLMFFTGFTLISQVQFHSVLNYILGVYALILFLAALRLCIHYTITEEGLIAKFLYIPFRKIPWVRVGRAMYVHKWKDIVPKYFGKGILPWVETSYGKIIFVSLIGCEKYIPSYHIRLFFSLRHPFRTMCLWLPSGSKYPTYQIVDIFQEYYPELKIQPTKQEDLGRFAGLTALHENAENGPITRN
jgi:hypothetical protein